MESVLAGAEDQFIPNLDLRLGSGASYVTQLRQATLFASIPTARPNGVNTIKFPLGSATEWCDPGSVVISFTVNNEAGIELFPATPGAHCLFERLQVRMAQLSSKTSSILEGPRSSSSA